MANRQLYIQNYARTLSGKLGIHAQDFEECELNPFLITQAVKSRHWKDIRSCVATERDGTRGKLAAAGIGLHGEHGFQMCLIHCGETWLNPEWGGSVLITQIAATAVLSTIAQNIYSYLADETERVAYTGHK